MWTTHDLQNESDVEQKFLYPFLVEPLPLGLGLPSAVIQTKVNIRRLSIGKGSEQKLYYPDYLVVTLGFPLIVIEAKSPTESVDEGFREARLYATELNSLYQHGTSPVRFVVASNGVELLYGHSDQAEPLSRLACESLGAYSPGVADMISAMSWRETHAWALSLAHSSRPAGLFKPRRLVGGVGIQNEEVGINTFGATLTGEISPIFNPTTSDERASVAREAYVPSRRRERYVDPIDRVIRAARPPSEVDALELEDSAKPTELIARLKKPRFLEHKVLLLIGSVGSGKSTFIDHLLEVALDKELLASTVWCRINMNAAPVTAGEIYRWLRREIVVSCRASNPTLDFDDLNILKKVFSVEIARFNKGVGKLYQRQPEVHAIKLGEHIESLQRDEQAVAQAHVRYTCAERRKLLVIVLDNCDKKTRDEQLLMFEAAQWLQKEFRCLVILPLRDETYDNHRNQPPLDTALKDLVFRIEPPLFQQVLMKRVRFALAQLGKDSKEKLRFSLPNGFDVEYPRSDQAFYLTSIVKSLFEHDRFARRMIVGLSGRNMRRALEIFLEFCNSGHIGEDQIFKIRQSEGNYALPLHQIATVLLRMNRRFYDSDHSYIKNVFAVRKDDALPSYFCRCMILQWLRMSFTSSGTAGLRGYFPKGDVKQALVPFGLDPDVVDREFNYLLAAQCVIAEHLRTDSVDDADLVRLGPAGFVHLELLSNLNYLAAVAEDTFFDDRLQAERVAERIKHVESHLHLKSVAENALELVQFLEKARSSILPRSEALIEGDLLSRLTSMDEAREALLRVAKSQASDPWFDADKRWLRGRRYDATVVNVVEYGYFAELGDGLTGLIHRSNLNGLAASAGDQVEVEILWVDVIQKKIGLKLTGVVQEEAGDTVGISLELPLGIHSDAKQQ